jgi:hypothetical protein
MVKLYVANCTKMTHDFQYRQPETEKIILQHIPAGHQVLVYKADATAAEVDHIISQHSVYGLVKASEVDRTGGYIGLCYSLDKPVKDTQIHSAMDGNDDHMAELSHEMRKISAAATDEQLRQADMHYAGQLEVEVVEQARTGDNSETMNEVIAVNPDASGKRNRGRPSRK